MRFFAARAAALVFLVLAAHAGAAALPQGPMRWATAQNDLGEVDPALPLTHLTVVMKRSPETQRAFEELLRAQQDPGSAEYHRWLTPLEVGHRFGASPEAIDAVTAWLESRGLHVDGVSNSRVRIDFSGSAADVGAAFGAPLHMYEVKSERRIAPAGAPQVPEALAELVDAVHGLATLHEVPHHRDEAPRSSAAERAKSTTCSGATCTHTIFPADFAAIYDVNPVYQQGVNGAGQTIAILGRANVYLPDIENFQKRVGLAVKDPVTVIPAAGIDPGPPVSSGGTTPGDQREATLDVTRAGSVAPGATILLVVSAQGPTTSGLGVGGQYVVDTNPVPAQVMSVSFGLCEQTAGRSGVVFWDNIFSQAAAEGISVFVSSGDAGAAGCDTAFATPPVTQSASPNYLCASSYATCVGGTQFADTANPNAYWRTTNTAGFESALGYIPEGAWNEPLNSSGAPQATGTGGGVSSYIATPSWQTGTGVPGVEGRYTPDISFSSAAHDGYFKCQAASGADCVPDATTGVFHFIVSAGTSAAAPDMAGIAALLNQKMGGAQGNLNPGLYSLAATPSSGVFHDVTVATSGVAACDVSVPSLCNNSTPGVTDLTGGLAGFVVGPGFDLATGLGSIDVANLVAKWKSTSAPGASANFQGLWWAAPAGSESGWGINLAHQGDMIFASWFTYDLFGGGNWLVMTAPKTAANTYSGTLYATTGPAFSAAPFNPALVTASAVGTATLSFTGASDGRFAYTIGATSQSKALTRQVFGALPACAPAASAASLAAATNYTDLWWASPASSESGWGINLTHQGSTIFASWFTYDLNGKPMWLVATTSQTGANAYSGTLFRTTGPPFNAVPFIPANVVATPVGSVTFTFSGGNSAAFAYTVNGTSQVKSITREVFSGAGTVCH